MVNTKLDRPAQRYLRQLNKLLGDLPGEVKDSILQDVEAHIVEATASGRNTDAVLLGLGDPEQLAETSRVEWGIAQPTGAARFDRGRILGGFTLAFAVIAAVVVSFFLRQPTGQHPDSGSSPEQAVATLLELYGPGVAVLTLLPAALVLSALLLPSRVRRWGFLGVAALLSIVVFVDLVGTGLFFVPAALAAWLAATLPYASRPVARSAEQLTLRILGAVLLFSPVVLVLSGLVLGNLGAEQIPLLIWGLFSLALALGYAMNWRLAHWVVLGYGIFVLGVGVVDAGILIAAFWVGGGVLVALGLYGLLRLSTPKFKAPTETELP
ncbi:HAAS signaling domain-containing protein [Glutamicibacter uratoxydans]|uniref:HAAS signaling domain-containing protein n=1 Tax=Glutamicibacter uratoxydans TaxID=43667 RepID=UPI003D6EC3BD